MSIDDFDGRQERPETDFQRPPALELDPHMYLGDFEEFDMSEEKKIELLQTLWSIMRSFVELGFEYDVTEQTPGDLENK